MVHPVRIRGAGLGGGAGARARGQSRPSGEDQPGFRTLVFGAQAVAAAGVALPAFLRVVTGDESRLAWLVALVCAAALACGHLTWCTHGRAWPPAPVLAVQAALGFLPLLPLGAPWAAASGFFAGGVLLTFRPARAVPAALLACVMAGLLPARPGHSGDLAWKN